MVVLVAHAIMIGLQKCPLDASSILIRKEIVRKAATR